MYFIYSSNMFVFSFDREEVERTKYWVSKDLIPRLFATLKGERFLFTNWETYEFC